MCSHLSDEAVGNSGLTGRCLVKEEDMGGFVCYELQFAEGTTTQLVSPYGQNWNHVYYVLQAKQLQFHSSDGNNFTAQRDDVIAMTGTMSAQLRVQGANTRLFVIFVPKKNDKQQPGSVVHRSMEKLIGTDRDIDWQHGRSRRFLRQDDGFNISIHNTINIPGSVSPIHYTNQFEAVYWIGGRGRFTWGGDNRDQQSHDWDYSEDNPKDSTMMVVGNTSHIVYSYEPGPISLAVFYPPLKGTETHDFSKGASSYQ